MSMDKPQTENLKLATLVTSKHIKITLDQIVVDMDRYCHRDPASLDENALQPLMASLVLERMQVPIEGYFEPNHSGRFVLVKGHRRVQSHRYLVQKNTPDFRDDMELDAIALDNYTPQDLLVRSIADNEVRLNLDRIGRIRAAKTLHDGSVEESRAATALGVSVKTYQRDLLIARYGWMFQHVIDASIDPTAATELLEAAEKHQRVGKVKDDFDAWVAEKKKELRDKEKLRKLQGGKELSSAEKQVKRFLVRHLLDHWLELVERGQQFDEASEWEYVAHLDKEKGQLHLGSVHLDLDKDPVEMIAKVGSKLSKLAQQLAPFVKKRLAEQTKDESVEEVPYDFEYLTNLGGEVLVNHLKERAEKVKAEGKDGEDEPQEAAKEREELDLAGTIDLADATLTPEPPAAKTSDPEATAPESKVLQAK